MAMIHEALSAIMGEVPAITKDKRNQQQGFQYRGIDDVYLAVHPLFVKHKVFSVPTVVEERSEERTTKSGGALIYRILRIKYDFFAEDGSFVSAVVVGEGMDAGDKASNKAMAVAHKYAILQILSIPVEESFDPDADKHEVAPRGEPQRPSAPPPVPALADEMHGMDTVLGQIMTASIGAVAAFSDVEKTAARNARATITKISEEDAEFLASLVREYRGKLEALRAAWELAGKPTPRPATLAPQNERMEA